MLFLGCSNRTEDKTEVTEILRKIEKFYSKTTVPLCERPKFEKQNEIMNLGKVLITKYSHLCTYN